MGSKAVKHWKRADAFLNGGEPRRALPLYRTAVSLDDALHQAHYGIAACHVALGDPSSIDEAVCHITKALKLSATPQYLDCAALVFLAKGLYDVALHYQKQATAFEPTAENIFKLSDMYKKLGMYQEALDTALPLVETPESAALQIPMHLASIYLTAGQYYPEGWQFWEWRRTKKGFYREYKDCDYWNGDLTKSIDTIFLYGEQGFGDIIQFSRFILTFKEHYPTTKIVYESSDPLRDLFKENFPIDDLVAIKETPSHFDTHCSLLSLAHRFKIKEDAVPYTAGYLKANEEKKTFWRQRLDGDGNKLKVGLVWHGQAKGKTGVDERRNIPFTLFEDMLVSTREQVLWYSVQKDIKPDRDDLLHDYSKEWQDFSDTAAFLSNLDLLITVDTAVAHLGGALGVPTWVLSRMDGCWRWGFDGDACSWYQSVRVFRSKDWLRWSRVLDDIISEILSKFAGF